MIAHPDLDRPERSPASRWDCGGCTACCRHFALGPVADDIIEGLRARDVQEVWAPAKDGFAVRRPGPDGEPAWFLTRREDGACVFLQDDGLCAIHARWGAEAKPVFCREYPFSTVREGDSLRVYVRADCGGWAEAFADGTLVEEQAETIAALPRLHASRSFDMDPIVVLPGLGLGQDAWPTVETAITPLLERPAPLEVRVHEVVSAVYRLIGRERPAAQPGRVDAAVAHAHARLRGALAPALSAPPDDDPETRGIRAYLQAVDTLLADAAPRLPSGPDDTRPPRALDDSAQEWLTLVLRHQRFGRTFAALGGLPGWLGSLVIGVRIAAAAAPGDPDAPVSARALGPGLATWVRLTRHPTAARLLADLRPVLEDVMLHAGAHRPGRIPGLHTDAPDTPASDR